MLKSGQIESTDLRSELQAWSAEIESNTLEEPLMSLAPLVFREFEGHFDSAQGPSGKWPPRKYDYPWPILIKTGFLKAAATEQGAPGNISRFKDGWAEFGVDVSVVNYAAFHEYGTSKLPPRPWAWMSSDAEDEVAERLIDALYALFVG